MTDCRCRSHIQSSRHSETNSPTFHRLFHDDDDDDDDDEFRFNDTSIHEGQNGVLTWFVMKRL